ncbi:M20 aminoacylase family protein [Pararhodobacter zhoushanensis]|uniref:M20 aminoacylase family protein n=1 Tax=Pararhodobacter zhoushanensis TaxID=2479545 RepID=UPI000F8CEEC8|nr:M20 aminoacylase family protein [Pararhodobacter zhoushanensis]
MPVKNRFAELHPEIAEWRQDLHAHPELRFDLPRTTAKVAALLRDFGVDEVTEGVGQSGIVAVIKGRQSGSGKVLGFRADMDALPIIEATGLPHASTDAGKMHACGHDGHTSILLGAAKYLAETRNFDGTVVLAFQPAEEGGGGARAMLKDGLMDRWGIQEVYGLHNMPGLPAGQFAIKSGPLLAAADFFEITVKGKGGHGAQPHVSYDSTLAASAIVMAMQQVVARNVDPQQPAVVSVTGFATDTMAHNVIPASVKLTGTVRTFDVPTKEMIRDRMKVIADSTAAAYGATVEFLYVDGVLPTINAEDQTDYAMAAAQLVAGSVKTDVVPSMGGEDFSEMLAERPGAFILLGNGASADLHHPEYEFNDEAIPAGCSWFATLAEQRMPLNA